MNRLTGTRPVEVLLVEDNPGDVLLTREVFEASDVPVRMTVMEDGSAAIAHLRAAAEPGGPPLPDLVLLDLNLPGVSGFGVLEEIRTNPDLLHLPVVVVTSSSAHDDVLHAYRVHANSFVTKPLRPREFTASLQAIESYWLDVAQLPSER